MPRSAGCVCGHAAGDVRGECSLLDGRTTAERIAVDLVARLDDLAMARFLLGSTEVVPVVVDFEVAVPRSIPA